MGAPGTVLVEQLAAHLGEVVSSMLADSVDVTRSEGAVDMAWQVQFGLSGAIDGTIVAGIGAQQAGEIARLVMGFDSAPEDEVVADALRELGGQAGGLLTQGAAAGARVDVSVERRGPGGAPAGEPAVFAMQLGAGTVVRVAWWCDVASQQPAAPPPSVPAPSAAAVDMPAASPNVEMLLDIELPLTVRFGFTEMTLNALTRVGPGSVIDLGRSPDDPVDVLVNGKIIARGEVVVVSGNYGVRITEVLNAADRIRSLGA